MCTADSENFFFTKASANGQYYTAMGSYRLRMKNPLLFFPFPLYPFKGITDDNAVEIFLQSQNQNQLLALTHTSDLTYLTLIVTHTVPIEIET